MELLDHLTQMLGYEYLSDLRHISITPDQAQRILEIPAGQYSIEEYLEAVRYIAGSRATACAGPEEARQALVEALRHSV